MVPKNRTRTQLTVYCQLLQPINNVTVSIKIETKNSKNIYYTWLTGTANYCEEVGKGHADIFGYVEQLLRKLDKDMVKDCPIKVKLKKLT